MNNLNIIQGISKITKDELSKNGILSINTIHLEGFEPTLNIKYENGEKKSINGSINIEKFLKEYDVINE